MLRFAVVGDPVSHSRSPAIHTKALRLAGLEGTYVARRVPRGGMAAVVAGIRSGELDGVNVTMPLKGEAYEAAELKTPEAERSSSVNTLRLRDGLIEGHSTDVVAFAEAYGKAPAGAPLLVLGAGGSARAAVAAWQGGRVFVSTRDPQKAASLGTPVPWGEPVEGAVVANATPIGMKGEDLPREVLEAANHLVDLPYGAQETPAVRYARERGIGHRSF
nr:MAG: hypothetical protein DIU67_08765 [Actinomycetota bacterium]